MASAIFDTLRCTHNQRVVGSGGRSWTAAKQPRGRRVSHFGFTTRGTVDTGPVVSFNPYDGNAKPGSVGVAVPDTEIEIVDVDSGTRRLGQGEQGEIRVRGPQIMSGYHNRPEENAATLRDGWLYTGDIGECDADGYLYIRDRKKDMVIVGGYNVYTREIDEVLHGHDAVLEAAAVGVADDYRGESIHAYVVLKRGASANAGEILDHCRSNLAKYKLPGAITFVDALPKTTVGKIDKKALRALNPVPPAQQYY